MAKYPYLPLWTDTQELRGLLIREGWQSPDTYSNAYAPITAQPAIYLFHTYEPDNYCRSLVAYVGMATNLSNRLKTHEILPALNRQKGWTMRWFKPTPIQNLRVVESAYIRRFNPPWNIMGRIRGVSIQ